MTWLPAFLVAATLGGLAAIGEEPDQAMTGAPVRLRLGRPFSHNAVFQRGREISVFGTDQPGSKITITFGSESAATTADQHGQWRLQLKPHEAERQPQQMRISGSSTIVLTNLVVGDVWLISGQSNADWPLRSAKGGAAAIAAATNTQVRVLHLAESPVTTPPAWSREQVARLHPDRFFSGNWKVSSAASVGDVSAIGYFFIQQIATNQSVPMGLIDCSVGGTPTESWIPPQEMAANARLEEMARNYLSSPMVAAFVKKRILQNLAKWDRSGRPLPMPLHPYGPSACWQLGMGLIAPFQIRGVLWYQGESNADFYDPAEFNRIADWHTDAFKTLVAGWRREFENPELPFYTVQLPLMERPSWPWFRESQARCAKEIANCALAVAYDLGTTNDVHPVDKFPVAQRLALLVRNCSYGERLEFSGPVLREWKVDGERVTLNFDHAAGGLVSRDGNPLRHFELAGQDRLFAPASAKVHGNTVELTAAGIITPVAVRYAWSPTADLNFFNGAGLPAAPFRTDNWPALNSAK